MNRSDGIKLLARYYGLSHALAQAKYTELKYAGMLDETLEKAAAGERFGEVLRCPLCDGELRKREGGSLGCTNYPKCKYRRKGKDDGTTTTP